MTATGQLNMMFEADTSTPVLPLPEHLNYGIQDRGMHRIPEIRGLYYFCGFLEEHAQRAFIKCIDTRPWRTDLERRVQHYGWRYDYRTRTVTQDMDLGTVAGLGGGRCVPFVLRDETVRAGSGSGDRQ